MHSFLLPKSKWKWSYLRKLLVMLILKSEPPHLRKKQKDKARAIGSQSDGDNKHRMNFFSCSWIVGEYFRILPDPDPQSIRCNLNEEVEDQQRNIRSLLVSWHLLTSLGISSTSPICSISTATAQHSRLLWWCSQPQHQLTIADRLGARSLPFHCFFIDFFLLLFKW